MTREVEREITLRNQALVRNITNIFIIKLLSLVVDDNAKRLKFCSVLREFTCQN
jgi:hypothetical protein